VNDHSSRFVTGQFAPVLEEATITDLRVTGEIPRELVGRYVRNGPNPLGPVGRDHHWFLGEGMLHGIRLRDGKAEWYRNRAVRAGTVPASLGERDPGGPKGFKGVDAAPNTNVLTLGGRTYATVEGGINPVEFDFDLNTISRSDFGGVLTNGFTAHTRHDPETGEHHAMIYNFAAPGKAHYLRLAGDLGVLNRITLPLSGATLVHDMAITRRHAVVFDLNLGMSIPKLLQRKFVPTFNPRRPGRVGVVPIDGSARDVRWFEVDPCFIFHAMNAHEEDGAILIDVCRYDGADAGADALGGHATLDRWRLDLSGASARVREERLDDVGHEFPQVNEGVTGRPYRYGYAIATDSPGRILKRDFLTGSTEVHAVDYGTAGEFAFVPRAGATAEDDGWLMGFVTHAEGASSTFLILNAADLSGEPAARIEVPRRIPLGFHGTFIPDRDIRS